MASNIGYSFQPGSGDLRGGGSPTPAQGVTQPVQTFNLQLPSQAAPGAIAPQSLLQGGGASATGLPDTQLLQMLMNIFKPQGFNPQPNAQPGSVNATPPGMGGGPGPSMGPRIDNGAIDMPSPSSPSFQQSGGGNEDTSRAPNGPQDYAPAQQPNPTPAQPSASPWANLGSQIGTHIDFEQGVAPAPQPGQPSGGFVPGGDGGRIDDGAMMIPVSQDQNPWQNSNNLAVSPLSGKWSDWSGGSDQGIPTPLF